ncbi:MAG TPA: hypothetical protein VF103_02930, partial [Polyangiaceae bacterium]
MRVLATVALALASSTTLACSDASALDEGRDGTAALECREPFDFEFVPDTLGGDEAYVCFAFDRSAFAGETISKVLWSPPTGGAFALHHAILYAVPGEFSDGPVICDGMPEAAVGLHVWSIGGDDLELPVDTALVLPNGTERFVVEAHTLRVADGAPESGRVRLCAGSTNPANEAALMGTGAPVPAIRPMHQEISEGSCALAGDVHLFSVWPHMHRVGKEISAELVRATGAATPLVDVTSWDFASQRTYPLDVNAAGGDAVRVRCVWENPSADYVLPGPKT